MNLTISENWTLFNDFPPEIRDILFNNLNLDYHSSYSSLFRRLIAGNQNPRMLLASVDGKVVGWIAHFHDHWEYKSYTMFFVHPDFRRKKIGSRLAEQARKLNTPVLIDRWSQTALLFAQAIAA